MAEENEEEDEDGETREKKDTGQQGPWKGAQTPAAPVVKCKNLCTPSLKNVTPYGFAFIT